MSYKQIIDSSHNILIVPENESYYLKKYHKIRKAIWWLSFLAYDGLRTRRYRLKKAMGNVAKFFLNPFKKKKYVYRSIRKALKLTDEIIHLCGSKFAYDMIKSKYAIKYPIMLVEPISKDFLDAGMGDNTVPRKNLIAYNPAKPSNIMAKLLLHKEFEFIALRGFTPQELTKVYREIKLYVDFGAFPGPERIPKEAVYNGACILVGKQNAASNDFDVAIPEQYKITDLDNETLIVSKIQDILDHYEDRIKDFEPFKQKIDRLEENFKKSIQQTFIKE